MEPEVLFSVVMSGMLGVVSYFLRQLLTDFKRVEKDVSEVKSTMALLKSEFKGVNDLLSQRIDFLEKRLTYLEKAVN